MIARRKELRFIEAEGFHHGVHEISTEPATGEVQAHFQHAAAEVMHDAIEPLKALEAAEAILTRQFNDAERHWHRLEQMTDGMRPEIVTPLLATLLATLAVTGETVLLAPVIDGFGIADPLWQVITAATLVTVAAGLVHLTARQLSTDFPDGTRPDDVDHGPPPSQLHRPAIALLAVSVKWWKSSDARHHPAVMM